jgi:tetrathionate reductase subunit B
VEEGGKPACMTTCMTGVRMFGDMDDPNSEISQFVARNGHRLRVFKREMNTKPRIFYRKA